MVARVALEHHERFTGKGYPYGLKGRLEEDPENGIHVYSRIISIADSYSALLMERVYKPALPAQQAIDILTKNAYENFDPDIFFPFINAMQDSIEKLSEKEKNHHGQIFIVEKGENAAKKIQNVKRSNRIGKVSPHKCSHQLSESQLLEAGKRVQKVENQ